jgi:hypothetical protein
MPPCQASSRITRVGSTYSSCYNTPRGGGPISYQLKAGSGIAACQFLPIDFSREVTNPESPLVVGRNFDSLGSL